MDRVTDKDNNRKNPNIIKTISIILSEIINENKAVFKGKDNQGNHIIIQININPFLILKSLHQFHYSNI